MSPELWGRSCAGTFAKRCLVELDLVVASDAVGDLLPGGGNVVGAVLRGFIARIGFRQLIFSGAVILEDARNARLDHGVGMVVGISLRLEIGSRVVLLVPGCHPVFN